MKVNESKFDGVVIDDEIEGVSEEQPIACPPAVSGELDGRSRQLAATVCMHFLAEAIFNTVHSRRQWNAYVPEDGKLAQLAAEDFGWLYDLGFADVHKTGCIL